MREIVLDTETTGLDPIRGDRLVEIGCIELVNHIATGSTFQRYINPERPMPQAAFRVHGLSDEFLLDKPVFKDIAGDLINFLCNDKLIIHNASFDLGFLNTELTKLDMSIIDTERAIDTMLLARKRYPGAPANLDALCRRFEIDNSERSLHGALLDAELLAEVYLELIGGRQPDLVLDSAKAKNNSTEKASQQKKVRVPRTHALSGEEKRSHTKFLESLDDPIWLQS